MLEIIKRNQNSKKQHNFCKVSLNCVFGILLNICEYAHHSRQRRRFKIIRIILEQIISFKKGGILDDLDNEFLNKTQKN
jgi:hypothetical protein